MQKHNRQMSYSLYISALAGSDTVVLFTGKCGKFTHFFQILLDTMVIIKPVFENYVLKDEKTLNGSGNVFRLKLPVKYNFVHHKSKCPVRDSW